MPPVVVLLRVMVDPMHTDDVPDITAGNALIATVAVRIQPEGIV